MIYYLNGKFISENTCMIDIADRGFLLGDGVFTTLKAVDGRPLHLDEHINRLNNNAQLIKISVQLDKKEVRSICDSLLSDNNLNNQSAIIRITITRGTSNRGINIPSRELQSPTILIRTMQLHKDSTDSLKLCSTSIIRNERSILTQIKSLNYLEPILAREEATSKGYDDGIMFNSLGNITESSVSNIFFLTHNQAIITPPLSDGVLPGIVRQQIIRICEKLKIQCIEQSIKLTDINNYTAAFLTNSVFGIKKISLIDNIKLSVLETTIQAIINAYNLSINSLG